MILDKLSEAASKVFPGSRVHQDATGAVVIVQSDESGRVLNTATSNVNAAIRDRSGALTDAAANCVQIMARNVFFSRS